jgi:hyperpolarization activated cyclic nucleotide-gated potassium channel 2
VQALVLIYVAIIVPYRIGFQIELEVFSTTWWWELGIDVYFLIDLILNFYTGFWDSDDALEMRRSKVVHNYLRGWFLIDFISCLPIQYVQLVIRAAQGKDINQGGGSQTKLLKTLRLFRLAKLLRLAKLRNLMYHLRVKSMATGNPDLTEIYLRC